MVKVKTDVLKVKVVREIKSNFKSYLSVILIAALAVFVVLHVRKRRLKKRREMDELRAEYENEDSD